MSAKKQLIRRYLLATMVGFVLGLVGLVAGYQNFLERQRAIIAESGNDKLACFGAARVEIRFRPPVFSY